MPFFFSSCFLHGQSFRRLSPSDPPPFHSPASHSHNAFLLQASWMEKTPICKQLSLINRLFRARLSKRACSMYNQGATMHKIAHTHKIGILSWCVLSFERLSDSTSLFPIQLCGQHTIRLLKELVREIFTLPNQYCSAQYKASPCLRPQLCSHLPSENTSSPSCYLGCGDQEEKQQHV